MREDYYHRGREKKKGEKRRRRGGRGGRGSGKGRSEVEEFVITDMSFGSSEFVDRLGETRNL